MVLSLKEIREEMEDGSLYENSFEYNGSQYYFFHDFGDDSYNFGVCGDTVEDTNQKYNSFDDIVNAHLISDKPFKDMLDKVNWLG